MLKKVLIIVLLIAGAAIAALLLFIEHNLAYAPIAPARVPATHKVVPKVYQPQITTVTGADGVPLAAVLLRSKGNPTAVIILLHGIASCKEHLLPEAQMLADSGFAVLVPDLRAHGGSGGKYCTFGYKEKDDIRLLVNQMHREFPGVPILLKGHSLGAAIALQVLAENNSIAGAVLSASFARLGNTVYNYMVKQTGIPYRAFSDYILSRSGVRAGFNPFTINPVESARKIKQPVLLVHGQFDDKIPVADCIEIFDALSNKQTEVYIVRNAGHDNLRQLGGAELIDKEIAYMRMITGSKIQPD